jgi:branched-chain amino acid transport system permease protein
VGGLGSVLGSVVGAVMLTLLPEALRGAKEYSDVVYGAILLGALVVAPKGIVGSWGSLFGRNERKARQP